MDSSGHAAIHYRVNPSRYSGGWNNSYPLSSDQIVGAINAAAQAWMAADPTVQLVYDGTTTADPDTPTGPNYNDVIGFEPLPSNCTDGLACGDVPPNTATYTGFDIVIKADASFAWFPCAPQSGQPCSDGSSSNYYDLQDLVVHEWGHVLGMAHPKQGQNVADSELTMWSGTNPAERHKDTLGLGDVLGERHLYPTAASMPTLYDP